MLEAVYHPNYVPEPNWYKEQLLIYDEIYRIVPDSVYHEFGASALAGKEGWNIDEQYLKTIDFEMPNKKYFKDKKKVIKTQLKAISKKRMKKYSDDNDFLFNTEKVPKWVGQTLLDYKLRKPNTEQHYDAEHYLIRKDAADYLMSCVSQGLCIRNGFSPLTNEETAYFMMYGNQLGSIKKETQPERNLQSTISGVFNLEVPNDMSRLSFDDVIDLRNNYSDLRKATKNCIKEIYESFHLDENWDKKESEERIKSALSAFEEERKNFYARDWKKFFTDWRVLSIGSVAEVSGGLAEDGSEQSLIIGLTLAGFSIISYLAAQEEDSDFDKTIQYFNKINKKIDHKRQAKKLEKYRNKLVKQYYRKIKNS